MIRRLVALVLDPPADSDLRQGLSGPPEDGRGRNVAGVDRSRRDRMARTGRARLVGGAAVVQGVPELPSSADGLFRGDRWGQKATWP